MKEKTKKPEKASKVYRCVICSAPIMDEAPNKKYCPDCAAWIEKSRKAKKNIEKNGPSLSEIMHEATKEGLQYVEYCKKHGLY